MAQAMIMRRGAAITGLPQFTYTGSYQLIDDGDYNWRIKFLTSGTLRFLTIGGAVDAFIAGGGGGGNYGGGGGGYTRNQLISLIENNDYPIVIGAGGAGCTTAYSTSGQSGGTSSAFGASALGGYGAPSYSTAGGNGGSGVVAYVPQVKMAEAMVLQVAVQRVVVDKEQQRKRLVRIRK